MAANSGVLGRSSVRAGAGHSLPRTHWALAPDYDLVATPSRCLQSPAHQGPPARQRLRVWAVSARRHPHSAGHTDGQTMGFRMWEAWAFSWHLDCPSQRPPHGPA